MDLNVSTAVQAAAIPPASITQLALQQIRVSGTASQARRRKRYDAAALNELAASIAAMGVIQPIIVRPKAATKGDAGYELVAGERRWLASKQNQLDTIPAIVRELDDADVLRIQVSENLDREGLNELEEAEAYEDLMKQCGYTVERLIAERGKTRAYLYARLKLLALGAAARKAFYDGKLNASTALLLARIPVPKLQDEALKAILEGYGREPLPYREAVRLVQQQYMLRLADAAFDKKDASLVPDAGACGPCPKRTGSQPELFADVKGADVCTDPQCFAAKRAAWSARMVEQAKGEGRPVIAGEAAQRVAPHGAEHNLQGGYVRLDAKCWDDAKGRTYRVLLGKEVAAPALLEDTRSGQFVEVVKLSDYGDTLKAKGVGARSGARDDGTKARMKAARIETAFRERVLAAIRAKPTPALAGAELRLIVEALWDSAPHDQRMRLIKIWGWDDKQKASDAVYQCEERIATLKEAELTRLCLDCALVREVHAGTWSNAKPETLLAAAKRLRVDAEAIRTTLKAELAAKTKGRGKNAAAATPDKAPTKPAVKTSKAKPTKARKKAKRS